MARATRSTKLPFLSARDAGVTVAVKLGPRASRDRIKGVRGDVLEVQVKAPPVDGKANEALLRLIARTVRAPKTQIELLRGQSGRTKLLLIRDATLSSVESHLLDALDD